MLSGHPPRPLTLNRLENAQGHRNNKYNCYCFFNEMFHFLQPPNECLTLGGRDGLSWRRLAIRSLNEGGIKKHASVKTVDHGFACI